MEFKPRAVSPRLDENTTPEEQMALLIRRKRVQEEKLIAQLNAERKRYAAVATELTLDIYRKRHYEYAQSFRSLSAILEKAGVRVVTYEGEELTDRMREEMNIVQWVPANGDDVDRVVEAFEPEVYVDGALTHRAKLICREAGEAPEVPAPKAPERAAPQAAAPQAAEPPQKINPNNHGSVSAKRLKKKKKAGRR